MAEDLAAPIAADPMLTSAPATRQPRELIDALLDAWNAHDLDAVMACYDPAYDGTDVGEAASRQGAIALRKMVRRWFRAFPDLRVTPEQVIVQGDQVALGWLLSATHQGAFMRIPATRRRITLRGVSMMTIADGRIARGSRIWDMAAFLRNVGLLPELRDTPED